MLRFLPELQYDCGQQFTVVYPVLSYLRDDANDRPSPCDRPLLQLASKRYRRLLQLNLILNDLALFFLSTVLTLHLEYLTLAWLVLFSALAEHVNTVRHRQSLHI